MNTIELESQQSVRILKGLSLNDENTIRDVVDIVVPEEHKYIVRERIKKYESSPGSYLSWNDIEYKMATRK